MLYNESRPFHTFSSETQTMLNIMFMYLIRVHYGYQQHEQNQTLKINE